MKSNLIPIEKMIQIIQEDIIGTENRTLAIALLLCIGGVIGLGFYQSSDSMSFMGVAESRERQINFERPVESRAQRRQSVSSRSPSLKN